MKPYFAKPSSGTPADTVHRKKDGTALYLTRDVSEMLGRVSLPYSRLQR